MKGGFFTFDGGFSAGLLYPKRLLPVVAGLEPNIVPVDPNRLGLEA